MVDRQRATQHAATVVGRIFDEADHRDPAHARIWIALVDGNNHQIDRIQAQATQRSVEVTILCDFIHVLEYLWKATWSFHDEGDTAAEQWVHDKAIALLQGKATHVAAGIPRAATPQGLDPPSRAGADACATYLVNKAPYLDYPTAPHNGWPITTSVIEGACRHLVKDRMDITGARWGLPGTKAISNSEPSAAMATSTPTGATTSHKNDTASTNPATATKSSRTPHDHSRRAAPQR